MDQRVSIKGKSVRDGNESEEGEEPKKKPRLKTRN